MGLHAAAAQPKGELGFCVRMGHEIAAQVEHDCTPKGAFANVGLENLYPGGLWWEAYDPRFDRRVAMAVVRERVEALTGASAALVDEVLRRLWGWEPRSEVPS